MSDPKVSIEAVVKDNFAPEMADQMTQLLDMIREQRRVLGLPPTEPPVPPTMQEWKEAEDAADDALTERVIVEHGDKNDLTDWMEVWYGRSEPSHKRNMPRFAILTSTFECWTPEAEAKMVHDIWTYVEWPGQEDSRHWRRLFERAGFECDDEDCDVDHTQPVTVYRGAFASHKRGLSWSLDEDRARWFAERGDMSGRGRKMRLYRCVVPADRVYGHHVGRGENEIVCDVRGLKIEVVE